MSTFFLWYTFLSLPLLALLLHIIFAKVPLVYEWGGWQVFSNMIPEEINPGKIKFQDGSFVDFEKKEALKAGGGILCVKNSIVLRRVSENNPIHLEPGLTKL